MKRVATAIGVGLALTAGSAQAIVIDNGIPIGTFGHFSVDVLTGGAIQSAVVTTYRHTSRDLVTQNVVSSYRAYVDPGIDGQGFALQGSEPVFANGVVSSTGTFVGANGNIIRWEAKTLHDPPRDFGTRYSFFSDTAVPIGPLRVYQYLDADIQNPNNDFLIFSGNAEDNRLSIMDNIEFFGVRQSFFGRFFGENVTFVGSAADRFDQIQQRIAGSGQFVSTTGAAINLPPIFDEEGGQTGSYGPANIVSVLAWDINPGVREARIDSSLSPEVVFEPEECEAGIDEECSDGPPPPVAPASKQFSCRTSGCVVPITCNLEAGCDAKVELFVNVKSIKTASKGPGRIRFAGAVASIPPGGTVSVRPKLTKRGRGILRANRSKTIKGVMAIKNSITGDLFSRTRVSIRLR